MKTPSPESESWHLQRNFCFHVSNAVARCCFAAKSAVAFEIRHRSHRFFISFFKAGKKNFPKCNTKHKFVAITNIVIILRVEDRLSVAVSEEAIKEEATRVNVHAAK